MKRYINSNEELRNILRECISEILEARMRKARGFEDADDDELSFWSRGDEFEEDEDTEEMDPTEFFPLDIEQQEDPDATQTLPTGYPDFNLPMDLYHSHQWAINHPKLSKNRQKDEPLMSRLRRRFGRTRGKKITEADIRKAIKRAILENLIN